MQGVLQRVLALGSAAASAHSTTPAIVVVLVVALALAVGVVAVVALFGDRIEPVHVELVHLHQVHASIVGQELLLDPLQLLKVQSRSTSRLIWNMT